MTFSSISIRQPCSLALTSQISTGHTRLSPAGGSRINLSFQRNADMPKVRLAIAMLCVASGLIVLATFGCSKSRPVPILPTSGDDSNPTADVSPIVKDGPAFVHPCALPDGTGLLMFSRNRLLRKSLGQERRVLASWDERDNVAWAGLSPSGTRLLIVTYDFQIWQAECRTLTR